MLTVFTLNDVSQKLSEYSANECKCKARINDYLFSLANITLTALLLAVLAVAMAAMP